MPKGRPPLRPPPAPAARPATLWHHGDFVSLWAGQTVSIFGSRLSGLALQLIAVVTLQASAAQMGVLSALDTAPVLVIGLFAGAWIDRRRRRPFLIVSDIGRALFLATVPLAACIGSITIGQLYAVTLGVGVLTVLFDIAYRSYLPSLVDTDRLIEANSKLELSAATANVTGLGLSGVVVQALTAPIAVLLDGLSYLLSAACLWRIRRPEARAQAVAVPMSVQVREGLALVARQPWLRATAACTATSTLFSGMFFALYTLYGTTKLGLQATQLGLIYGVGAVGAVVGPLLAETVSTRFGLGRTLLGAALLGSLEVFPALLATPVTAVPMLVASSFVGNLGWTVYNVNATALRQAITPAALQGRMTATIHVVSVGMSPVGSLLGGLFGQCLGLRGAIAIGAFGSACSFLWLLLSSVRRLGALPTP